MTIKFAENLGQYLHFPITENEQRANILHFYETYQFPSISGCIDCTHIPIQNPGDDNGQVFRNRKGYFSLNVQVIYIVPYFYSFKIISFRRSLDQEWK